jgi:phosphate transport system substrate-binding protein
MTFFSRFSRAALTGVFAGLAGLAYASTAGAAEISGAGATFPYPVYAKWAEAYKAKTGTSVNYQSIGSGGGIKQIQAKTVDFGASDMPLKADELEKWGLVQFPTVMGGVVPVVNVKGLEPGKLKLDGPTLAAIYLGEIGKWNDPKIAALNPGVALPNQAIAPVYRSDGSGTTFLFTDYLSKVSPAFKEKVGSNTAVQWPAGLGGKGNEGVAALAGRTAGAIGYVEYAYAKQTKMSYALLQNGAGTFVAPESDSFQAAAANADWSKAPGYFLVLTNQPGEKSWPITGASFILLHKTAEKPEHTRQVFDFFAWAFKEGDQMAEALDYVPLPDTLVRQVEQSWTEVKGTNGQPVWSGS